MQSKKSENKISINAFLKRQNYKGSDNFVYSTTYNIFRSDALRCTHLLHQLHYAPLCSKSPLFSITEGCGSDNISIRENVMGCTVLVTVQLNQVY